MSKEEEDEEEEEEKGEDTNSQVACRDNSSKWCGIRSIRHPSPRIRRMYGVSFELFWLVDGVLASIAYCNRNKT